MAKVNIDSDEWYPVYFVNDGPTDWGVDISLHDFELLKVKRVFKEFDDMQTLLRDKVNEALALKKGNKK